MAAVSFNDAGEPVAAQTIWDEPDEEATTTTEPCVRRDVWAEEPDEKAPVQKSRSVLNVTSARFRVTQRRWFRTVSEKDIVSNVSVSVRSGEMLAIMGPSGAGKTSFLDLLTMEGSGGVRNGYVDINGEPLTLDLFRTCCSYVPQHDQVWGFLTCRETLQFSADLFHGGGRAGKAERVAELLSSMGLESCADTKVGNELVKGLSGGQRRRLSLALAMMKDPLVLFLDEITSGLDAAAAAGIARFLQRLARSKDVIIVCTIHQPSAKVFAGFDNLLLLSGGRAAFSGEVADAEGFFSSLGCQIPQHENPADFLLDAVNADFQDRARVEEVIEAWQERQEAVTISRISPDSSAFDNMVRREFRCWCREVAVLFRRSATLAFRDPTSYLSRIVAFMVACGFFATVYSESRNRNQFQVVNRFWLVGWLLCVPSLFSMTAALSQNFELSCVRREVKSGMYRVSSYLAAQHLIQLPFILALALASIFPGYAIANWDPAGFWEMLLVESVLLFCFESVAQFFGAAFHRPLVGISVCHSFWIACFLFTGFMLSEDDVPMPIRLVATVSPIKWAVKAANYVEFSGAEFEGAVPDDADPRGFSCPTIEQCYGRTGLEVLGTLKSIFKNLSTEDELPSDCAMVLVVAAVFRLMYFAAAWLRCRSGVAVKPLCRRHPAEVSQGTRPRSRTRKDSDPVVEDEERPSSVERHSRSPSAGSRFQTLPGGSAQADASTGSAGEVACDL